MGKISHTGFDVGTGLAKDEWESESIHAIGGVPDLNIIAEPSSPVPGDLLYYTGASWNLVHAGTVGHSLKTAGTASPPYFEAGCAGVGTPSITLGTVAAVGSGSVSVAIDATIAAFNASVPESLAFGGAGSAGNVNYAARINHGHAMPADPRTFVENTPFVLVGSLSADGKYSGFTEAGTAGTALSFGHLIYQGTTDKRWRLTDANAESTSKWKLGMCVAAATGDGSPTTVLLWGNIRADTMFPTMGTSAPIYVGTAAGSVATDISGYTTSDIIRCIGHADTPDQLHFSPSNDYFEHA